MKTGRGLRLGGGIAAAVGVVCCVTPLLPMAAGAVGAGAVLHYIYTDVFLIPLIVIGLGLCGVGFWKGRQTDG